MTFSVVGVGGEGTFVEALGTEAGGAGWGVAAVLLPVPGRTTASGSRMLDFESAYILCWQRNQQNFANSKLSADLRKVSCDSPAAPAIGR